jgi:hypothetical protein
MGGKSGDGQVVGYKYYANHILKIGGPIDGIVGINFENKGWIKLTNNKEIPVAHAAPWIFSYPNLFGENEGGVDGVIHVYTGTNNQAVNEQYKTYYPLASAYPYESYLVFTGQSSASTLPKFNNIYEIKDYILDRQRLENGFYIGNLNRIRECLINPQRVNIRDDGRPQWYASKAAIFNAPPQVDSKYAVIKGKVTLNCSDEVNSQEQEISIFKTDWNESKVYSHIQTTTQMADLGNEAWGSTAEKVRKVQITANFSFDQYAIHKARLYCVYASGSTMSDSYVPEYSVKVDGEPAKDDSFTLTHYDTGGAMDGFAVDVNAECRSITIDILIRPHVVHIVSNENDDPEELISSFTSSIIASAYYPAFTVEPSLYEPRDINIVHEVRGILTDKTALGLDESLIDDENFMRAADKLHSEGLGISWGFSEKQCGELIDELCYHGEMGVRINRQTGLYQMVLFRDDWFDSLEIHSLTKNKIKSFDLEIKKISDVINKLNVEYYDREKIKRSSFSLVELGALRNNNNRFIVEEVKFPYFYRFSNANKVASWKLRQMSVEKWSGTLRTGWRDARGWNKFDLIWLPSLSNKWSEMKLFRIMRISIGKEVEIDIEEVVQQINDSVITVQRDDLINVDRVEEPKQLDHFVEEASYYSLVIEYGQKEVDEQLAYNPDHCKLCVLANTRQDNALSASLYSKTDENDPFVYDTSVYFYESANIIEPFDQLSRFVQFDKLPADSGVGDIFFVSGGELMAIKAMTLKPGRVEVYRGILDSYPTYSFNQKTKVTFYKKQCISNSSYDLGDAIITKLAMVTPTAVMDLDKIKENTTKMLGRAFKPYPAQNIKIAGQYFPTSPLNASVDNVLSWSHRNRLQQTSTSQHVDWFDGDVTAEPGVTYTVQILNVWNMFFEVSGITSNQLTIPSGTLIDKQTIYIYAVRDGVKSRAAGIEVEAEAFVLPLTATTTGRFINGATLAGTPITADVDTALRAQMHANGRSIVGKAPAGSIIKIEVLE